MTDITNLVGYDFKAESRTNRAAAARKKEGMPLVDFQGKELFMDQYEALEDMFNQNGTTADRYLSEVGDRFSGEYRIQDGLLTHLILSGFNREGKLGELTIATPLRKLTVPRTLTEIQDLTVSGQKLEDIDIPLTLTQLESLDCSWNNLVTLQIPPTLTKLEDINCIQNKLQSITIPSHINPDYIDCRYNPLSNNRIEDLRDRGIRVDDRS